MFHQRDEIQRALEEGRTTLDLSYRFLFSLDKSLTELTDLRELNIAGNHLSSLPEWICELKELRALDVSGNLLTHLPESIGELSNLRRLFASNNQLSSLPRSLGRLTKLEGLYASSNLIKHLDGSLIGLCNLTELYLVRNNIQALPDEFGRLKRLQSLHISQNELQELPGSIEELSRLRDLVLTENKLSRLGSSFESLADLRILRLDHNLLAEMPAGVANATKLSVLDVSYNQISQIEESIGQLSRLQELIVSHNQISSLPKSISALKSLKVLDIGYNECRKIPQTIGKLRRLSELNAPANQVVRLPDSVGDLESLERLDVSFNKLVTVPDSIGLLPHLSSINVSYNPLSSELRFAYDEGTAGLLRYLRAKSQAQVSLHEAKLILIGEGEVGKSCLLGALRGDPWLEGRPTTHGIEIKPVKVLDPNSGIEITLNGWDFGGQRVYRPTHQLFFSAPAVYVVVWKPREGPQQGFVREWIKLVKHREPEAKILVVATHGGPRERQPDIDRQEIWDLFGTETVVDFFHVDSRPRFWDEDTGTWTGDSTGVDELRGAIARVAATLPEMGRSFPTQWQEARSALKARQEAYLSLRRVFSICNEHGIVGEEARLLLKICHRVGDLIHYEHDPTLRDIVVLKPDWLATAISFVLDDETTRKDGHGLASFERLAHLWQDPGRPKEHRYPANLHRVFLRLMERFDLSYRVAEAGITEEKGTSLIAQLVPDVRPQDAILAKWPEQPHEGDEEQVQICRVVEDDTGRSAPAEGLFYQLIVRLHKYSLGRVNYEDSIHWQRGLLLEDDTGARAFLAHVGYDVRITVRSPYPERFLAALTYEVKWLVENFWEGLRCDVTVPCLTQRGSGAPCAGLFEVGKLLENKKRKRPEQPCSVCNEWQGIERLLRNAPAARENPMQELLTRSDETLDVLRSVRRELGSQGDRIMGRFDALDAAHRETVSKVEAAYDGLMRALLDEAKDGPRLFSVEPLDSGWFDRPNWVSAKFRVTLWCEHSRLPLTALYRKGNKRGVYDLTMPRGWLVKAAPFLRVLATALSLIVPVAASATKLALDEASFRRIEEQLDLGQKGLDAVIKGGKKIGASTGREVATPVEGEGAVRARGPLLRQLHAWIAETDPSFGGLVRVRDKRQEFLWVHPKFEKEY